LSGNDLEKNVYGNDLTNYLNLLYLGSDIIETFSNHDGYFEDIKIYFITYNIGLQLLLLSNIK